MLDITIKLVDPRPRTQRVIIDHFIQRLPVVYMTYFTVRCIYINIMIGARDTTNICKAELRCERVRGRNGRDETIEQELRQLNKNYSRISSSFSSRLCAGQRFMPHYRTLCHTADRTDILKVLCHPDPETLLV